MGGEWCGPLVPAEEVEKAYEEGRYNEATGESDWIRSRAYRVALGEEA